MQQRSNIRFMSRQEVLGYIMLAVILLAIIPLSLDVFRLNLIGKYLTYAFVALGLVLCWGYGGILSLGQGVFFGLGGYCMAMFLKLEASDPESTKIQSTPGIPDFMDWNQITELPWWWEPFRQLPFALSAIVLLPTLFAFIIGVAMFKRRVGGVYFAIITQAVAAIMTILIIGQQGYTGGVNGITDLRTLLGWDIRSDSAKVILYYVCSAALFICLLLSQFIRYKKLGRILVAMRDREDRVRFSGYDVANFKIFVFCLSAMFSAIGGAMFTLQVGFMSPSFVGIVPSIEMVIYCAVGGRLSLLGAVYGTLLVNWAKTIFSETFPELWLFAMGALFIAVVMAFPNGLASLFKRYIEPKLPAWYTGKTIDFEPEALRTSLLKADEDKSAHPDVLALESNITASQPARKTDTTGKISPHSDEKLDGGVYVD
ncbi:urea ABC transporter permease subunit UrtC [Methylotuvimicrobium sp.]|uniref:urea ABC transporter permease subunit UrtC n=1 Tax=Methylotuvimicrobium sp. TaxID=2822413 RepID=UPI003D647392